MAVVDPANVPADQVPSTPTSPKVIVTALVGLLVTVAVAGLDSVTLETTKQFGILSPVIYAACGAAAGWITGWWKTDPLRAYGAKAMQLLGHDPGKHSL